MIAQRIALLSVATIAFTAANACGQDVAVALHRVESGARVRISAEGVRRDGRLHGLNDTQLELITRDGRANYPISGIDTVWIRQPAAGRGALIGGAIGASALTGFLEWLVAGLCDNVNGCGSDQARVAVLGIGVGGGAGAIIGAAIGSGSGRWVRAVP